MTHNSDDDLIRRGDALAAVIAAPTHMYMREFVSNAIAAIPAAVPAVRVKPLKFEQVHAELHAAETPFGFAYEVWGDYWRDPFSRTIKQAADPIAAAQADYEAHIRAALDLTPAPAPDVAGLVRAACNLRAFVDLFARGDEGMRLAVREFDAALAAMEDGKNG